MKFLTRNRTRTAVAGALVALVAFGGVATASALDIGPYDHDAPAAQPPTAPGTKASGVSVPVQKEFVAVAPCRIFDTRSGGGAKLPAGSPRLVNVAGANGCGVPANASAAVISLSSTQADGNGYLRAWAFGGAEPQATVLNYTALGSGGITTGATVPINGGMDIKAFGHATHVVIDVTGYYVEPIAAVVGSGGNLGSHSKTITGASRNTLGYYTLTFSQDLTGCSLQATADTSFYSAGGVILGTTAAVYTRNITAVGSPYGDSDFAVTITC